MTKAMTVRLPPDLLNKAEARASKLGVKRTRYVRGLIERDVNATGTVSAKKHVFASKDLIGYYEGEEEPATNARVRERLRLRACRKP
jgi:hypothetical protein